MVPRQSLGRRFIDLRPDAPTPSYPVELERRRCSRRQGDRLPNDPRKARRVPLLFTAHWSCAWCGHELYCRRNIHHGRRRFVVVERPSVLLCDCREWRLAGEGIVLTWEFQGGDEL